MENVCPVEKIVAQFGQTLIFQQNIAIRSELPTQRQSILNHRLQNFQKASLRKALERYHTSFPKSIFRCN